MPPKPTKQVNRNVERRYNNNKKTVGFDKSIDFVEEDKKTERRWKQVKESKVSSGRGRDIFAVDGNKKSCNFVRLYLLSVHYRSKILVG
mmetsp:Transcript_12794/g.31081  ORF Transcript_12794/g.31081 Transcript_12794/m.31081 type:complete len:89 (-) Transcript_12794:100-366(-)